MESGAYVKPGKSKLEKTLIVVSALLVAAVIGLLIGLIVVLTAPPPEVPLADDICYTETCVERSLWIMRAIDNTTKPCDDFYQYACGKWAAENEIPPDKSRIGTTSSIGDDVNKMLNKSLSSRVVEQSKANENAQNKAAYLYQRCLESDESAASSIYSALKTIVNEAGGCGLLTAGWSADTLGKSQIMAAIQALTRDSFLSVYVTPDLKNSSRNRISISQPELNLELKTRYTNVSAEPYVTYRQLVRDVFSILRTELESPVTDEDFNQQIDEMLEFEKKVAAVTYLPEDLRDETKTYSLIAMQNLDAIYKDLVSVLVNDLVKKSVDPTEQIQLIVGANFMESYLAVLNSASTRALANYGIWTLIYNELFAGLPSSVRELQVKLVNVLQGSNPPARWLECLQIDTSYLDFGIGRLYVDEHLDKEIKKDMNAIVETLVTEFRRSSLEANTWIDDETKKRALTKLNTMGREIAFPDFILDDTKLNAFYANVTLPTASTTLFINILRDSARGTSVRIMNEWVTLVADRKAWSRGPQTVNAFYSPNTNTIYMPAGFLYPPFYGADLPRSMKYGGIGQVAGHEISHGFDDMGRQYDENGNMINWWTDSSIAEFNTRAECVVQQYSEQCFEDLDMCINGEFTQGENIADLGGLRTAYEAYVEWKKTNRDKKLPGLTHYTDEQMVFLTLAHVLCSKYTPQRLKSYLESDPHSPSPYRVNVNLQNLEQFSQVWNCAEGTAMNLPPEDECRVW